ncbi:MAG: hypothetical protein C0621_08290 [Desulfuromonas sp.]|nr:MAG: hypothetical protein C0621_08290 [Desulfuromonas sp.]
MALRYLLCPQCGVHRFFVRADDGSSVFFHVGLDRQLFTASGEPPDLKGSDTSVIYCAGCSWKGGIHKLVKIFCG